MSGNKSVKNKKKAENTENISHEIMEEFSENTAENPTDNIIDDTHEEPEDSNIGDTNEGPEDNNIDDAHKEPEDSNADDKADEPEDDKEEEQVRIDTLTAKDYMKDMSPSEKRKYLIYYYKWYVIIGAIFLALVAYFVVVIRRNRVPSSISYAVINAWDLTDGLDQSLFEDYAQYYDRTDGYTIRGDNQYMFTVDTITDPGMSYGAYLRFNSLCPDDYFDIIITDKAGLDFCVADDLSLDVDQALSPEVLQMYEGHIVSMKDSTGETHNFAIDVSDIQCIKRIGLPYDKVYITFPGDSETNISHAEEFLRYIKEQG